jgi:hypothetical protein
LKSPQGGHDRGDDRSRLPVAPSRVGGASAFRLGNRARGGVLALPALAVLVPDWRVTLLPAALPDELSPVNSVSFL